jgi:hypothetical protein
LFGRSLLKSLLRVALTFYDFCDGVYMLDQLLVLVTKEMSSLVKRRHLGDEKNQHNMRWLFSAIKIRCGHTMILFDLFFKEKISITGFYVQQVKLIWYEHPGITHCFFIKYCQASEHSCLRKWGLRGACRSTNLFGSVLFFYPKFGFYL